MPAEKGLLHIECEVADGQPLSEDAKRQLYEFAVDWIELNKVIELILIGGREKNGSTR